MTATAERSPAAARAPAATLSFHAPEPVPSALPLAAIVDDLDPARALRRLVPMLDAALDGPDRVALWRALGTLHQRADAATWHAAKALLDGRHAARLSTVERTLSAEARLVAIARATPDAARGALVLAGLEELGADPVGQPHRHEPALVLLAVDAALRAAPARLPTAALAALETATMTAAGREPELLPQALALVFELALQAADETTATAALAELVVHGHAALVRGDRLRGWLDGTAFGETADDPGARVLMLAPPHQRQWLHPSRWADVQAWAELRGALHREAPRARLQSLIDALPAGPRSCPALPRTTLELLSALDLAWQLVEAGGDPLPVAQPLLDPSLLDTRTLAALQIASADAAAERADAAAEAVALIHARRRLASAALRRRLASLLPLQPPDAPAPGVDWHAESTLWLALADHTDARWRDAARLQLAIRATDGQHEPLATDRCSDIAAAARHWQALADRPAHAEAARAALQRPEFTLMAPALRTLAGVEHLWFENPGAERVMIVFSCVASHHGYAEVQALRGRLPGRHLMFVRCPRKDWYCDDTYDEVRALLRDAVAARFGREQVSCWYGSMGGHGALKFALEFGWRALVFNPQIDLDLWAAFRPRERALLLATRRERAPIERPVAQWERTPLYYACGSATADREALSRVIERLRACRKLTAIVEKFDDREHAGLMNRIAGGPVAPVLDRIDERLTQLAGSVPHAAARAVAPAAAGAFWRRLDALPSVKLELQVREGCIHWQPSVATGTRPAQGRR